MESLLVHPENAEQLEMLKVIFINLKIPFEIKERCLPLHVIKGIERGLKQAENGQTISLEEFKEKHFSKRGI